MSKAFTREENDGPDLPEVVRPDFALGEGERNYLTPEGAERLQAELDRLVREDRPRLLGETGDPETRRILFKMNQRIRQLEESLHGAEILRPVENKEVVRFGAKVTVRDEEGAEETYRLVGVAESGMEADWISWQSPLGRALLDARAGDRIRLALPAGSREVVVVAIDY